MVATDGQKLTLGDTTLTMYITPGHTLGTISTLIPVKDHGTPHLVAEWGGTAFNWLRNRPHTSRRSGPTRSGSRRYSNVGAAASATSPRRPAPTSSSPTTRTSTARRPSCRRSQRKAGDPNPYVVGNDSRAALHDRGDECAQAGLLRTRAAQPPQAQQGGGGFNLGNLPPPMVKEGVTAKLGPHSYVIPDGNVVLVPNVGIVVGSKATLVVDTGMGPRNGAAVMREVAKVSKNTNSIW